VSRKIIRKPEVRQRTGLSDTQVWRLEGRRDFPARIQLGPNSTGWYEDEVDEWVHSRIRAGGRRPSPRNRRAISAPDAAAAMSAASSDQS
jgi:prophage regulatory protein